MLPESKKCSNCQTEKLLECFPPARRYLFGVNSRCRQCISEYGKIHGQKISKSNKGIHGSVSSKVCRKCKTEKLALDFSACPSKKDGLSSFCKACRNSSEIKTKKSRTAHLKLLYGITSEDRSRMINEQGGQCAICYGLIRRPYVDHCPTHGKVRGILCNRCNCRLGVLEDLPFVTAAKLYLERSSEH